MHMDKIETLGYYCLWARNSHQFSAGVLGPWYERGRTIFSRNPSLGELPTTDFDK